jgi:hypothetical protein
MLQSKFMVGDEVYVNSNPEIPMTVKVIMPNSQVIVHYYLGKKRHVENFPTAMLTLVKK